MLQQLLDVVRGKSTGSELCSVREVIGAAWSTVAPLAEARQIDLHVDVPDGLECPMERARMERVFSNLFENAIEAIRTGGAISIRGTISIRAQAEGESVMVRVEDSGPGISDALRGRLFQPFATAGKKNGLGLGLALSRQTLLDHGGDIWADDDDTGQGVGARFCLRLPKNRAGVMHEPAVLNGAG
jgi:signal transduction histidine kinase